jgi:hypothetical protein
MIDPRFKIWIESIKRSCYNFKHLSNDLINQTQVYQWLHIRLWNRWSGFESRQGKIKWKMNLKHFMNWNNVQSLSEFLNEVIGFKISNFKILQIVNVVMAILVLFYIFEKFPLFIGSQCFDQFSGQYCGFLSQKLQKFFSTEKIITLTLNPRGFFKTTNVYPKNEVAI